jgi:hypothetical protein
MRGKDMEMNFTVFISGLMAEGMMALGVLKNPVSGEVKKDLEHASHVIDALNMLEEKTKGNLTDEEEKAIEEALHNLRMMYVAETSGSKEEKKQEESKKEEKSEG